MLQQHRSRKRFAALAAGFVLVAAACGDDDDAADDVVPDETPAPGDTPAPDTGATTGATTGETGGTTGETDPDGTALIEPTVSESTSATTDSGAAPTAGGELVDLQNFSAGDPDHIDPALAGVISGAQISRLVYDGLLEWDWSGEEGELVPEVATEFEMSEDGLTYTFTIGEYMWSDGEPVLASDFEFAWNRATDPALASEINYHYLPIAGASERIAGEADAISGVVADDEAGTLEVTLVEPFASFPATVTHSVFSPMPAHLMADLGDQTTWEQGVMVGNGPFAMEQPLEPGREIVLVRNDSYSGTPANVDSVRFVISSDVDSAYAAFQAGDGDTAAIPSGRFEEATSEYDNATDEILGLYHFFINQESQLGGPENLKLRQAISMAIDREAINTAVYDGSRTVASGGTPPGVPGFEEGLCEFCAYDPEQATTLVGEWEAEGGTLDQPITINFNAGAGHEDVVAIVQQNLQAIGLDATLDGRESTTYFTEMRQGACEFCRAGWIWDYPAYYNGTYALMHSDSIEGDNIGRINDPELDAAIDEATLTTDEEARFALHREAEQIALNEVVGIVPFNWYRGNVVYSDRLEDFEVTPLFFLTYETVSIES